MNGSHGVHRRVGDSQEILFRVQYFIRRSYAVHVLVTPVQYFPHVSQFSQPPLVPYTKESFHDSDSKHSTEATSPEVGQIVVLDSGWNGADTRGPRLFR